MQSLKAFFSYVRQVDDHDGGRLSRLRARLQGEIQLQTGLRIEIYQDIRELKWGDRWEKHILDAAAGSLFLIPVVTPGYFLSEPCRAEYHAFKAHERKHAIEGVVLPIYYVESDELSDPAWRQGNAWAEELAATQWSDWRTLRLEPWESPEPNRRVEQMAKQLKARLRDLGLLGPSRPVVSPVTVTEPTLKAIGMPEQRAVASTPSVESQAPAPLPARREVVIDASGRGTFRSVMDAVNAAKADDVLLIRPGTYRESLVITKSLTLIGDGALGGVILETSNDSTIEFNAPFGRIVNLTIRQSGGTEGDAVLIGTGRLELEGCDITSALRAAVVVKGDAEPSIRRNRIHGSAYAGVLVSQRARANIEDNDVFSNGYSGVEISDEADPVVRRNRIHDGRQNGIFVYDNGRGTIEDNDIFTNAYSGVEIKGEAAPVLRRNRIHDGRSTGIYVHQNAQGTIEDNDIVSNANAGIHVQQGGDPIVRKNRINKNGYEAVWVNNGGRGTFEGNDLRENQRGPWDIASDCLPNVKRSDNIE